MNYPDGVYLIKGPENYAVYLCFFRDGSRSAGKKITRPLKEVFTTNWPYMSIPETEKDFQITYIGSEDFIHGMIVVIPNMTGKDLLEQLSINYEFEE